MLDVVYLVAILALFALVALVAQGVEKLGPQPGTPSARTPGRGAQPPAPAPASDRSSRSATPAPAPERGGDTA